MLPLRGGSEPTGDSPQGLPSDNDVLSSLPEGSELLRSLIGSASTPAYAKDLRGRFLLASGALCELAGVPADRILGRTAEEVFSSEAAGRQAANDAAAIRSGAPTSSPERAVVGGRQRDYITTRFPIRDREGAVVAVAGICVEVTDARRAEDALRESEEKFRLAFHTIPLAINLNRLADGLYVDINEGFTRLTGYERSEVLGRSSLDLSIWADAADRRRLVRGLSESGFVSELRAGFRKKNGEIGIGAMSARVMRVNGEDVILSITRDITAELDLEERYRQAQKMEAIGRLAGGIAHDLNNLLVPLLNYTELVQQTIPPGDERHGMLEEALNAARRGAALTRQILTFSRKQVVQLQSIDLNALIAAFRGMIVRLLRENIEVRVEAAEGLDAVWGDPAQLEQVLMNLILNAGDAMPGGGTLVIATGAASAAQVRASGASLEPTADRYAFVSVGDTGSGMEPETLRRAFEPFFTTKASGTGLGLATVSTIAAQHGGGVAVQSESGRGTTFTVYLPFSGRAGRPEPSDVRAPASLRGSETVMLVEDDEHVRSVVSTALQANGYTVIAAGNAASAIGLAESGRYAAPRLLLTDVIMPGVNGRELHSTLAGRYPGLKVLFMSGYPGDVLAHHGILEQGIDLLQKPFTVQALLARVRTVLDRGQRNGSLGP